MKTNRNFNWPFSSFSTTFHVPLVFPFMRFSNVDKLFQSGHGIPLFCYLPNPIQPLHAFCRHSYLDLLTEIVGFYFKCLWWKIEIECFSLEWIALECAIPYKLVNEVYWSGSERNPLIHVTRFFFHLSWHFNISDFISR